MIFIVLLVLALIIVGPLLTIWSLNTLFGLTIAYTLKTWFAAMVLGGIIGSKAASK